MRICRTLLKATEASINTVANSATNVTAKKVEQYAVYNPTTLSLTNFVDFGESLMFTCLGEKKIFLLFFKFQEPKVSVTLGEYHIQTYFTNFWYLFILPTIPSYILQRLLIE